MKARHLDDFEPDDASRHRDEMTAVISSSLFGELSAVLRHDILRLGAVRRYTDGQQISAQGQVPSGWMCCCGGTVRISKVLESGKQFTLDYLQEGIWFGHSSLLSRQHQLYGAYAHEATSVFTVPSKDFMKLLVENGDLPLALLRMSARRSHALYRQLEAFRTQALRLRLARQLIRLARAFGTTGRTRSDETLITLQLCQEELAQLVGGSRQRINLELKQFEREHLVVSISKGIVIRVNELAKIAREA